MASSVSSRELILETLLMITRDGQYSHIALKNVLVSTSIWIKKKGLLLQESSTEHWSIWLRLMQY